MKSHPAFARTALRALATGLLACALSSAALRAVTLSATGITLNTATDGSVQVLDAGGVQRMLFNGYKFTHGADNVSTGAGVASLVTVNGRQAVQVDYAVTGDSTGAIVIRGQFTPQATGRLDIHYDVWAGGTPANWMLRCRAVPDTTPRSAAKVGLWTRHAGGGIPYETRDLYGFQYSFTGLYALLKTPGGNLEFSDAWSAHLPLTAVTAGQWKADASCCFVTNPAVRVDNAAAIPAGRPVSVDLSTAQSFNLWNSSAAPLVLNAQAYNNSASAKTLTLTWWARDFAGNLVASSNASQSVAAYSPWDRAITFTAPERGILFVEVGVSDGTDTAFARTNLAVLPPYAFTGSASESIFGLSYTFKTPSGAAELPLLQRMGVRHQRMARFSAAEASSIGMTQEFHSNNTAYLTGAVPQTWIDGQLNAAVAAASPSWEVSNEMNMTGGGVGTGDNAANYVTNFLIPAKNRRDVLAPGVQIMMGGLAGMDNAFTTAVYNAGGWPCLDAFAVHPGRGNYAADYPGENNQVSNPNSWNFLGTLRKAKDKIATHGFKPLYVTEAYACTAPNSGWFDTPRHAAENIVLSYALALQEGVEVMHWFQLNDGRWLDIGGVDPADSEYHYGLLNRDLSPKPSLLAYTTIAEALDGATFDRWMSFAAPTTHGLQFTTPIGPMAVLWDRADGYTLTNSVATAEPWTNPWPTTTALTLSTQSSSVGLVDPLYFQPFDNTGSSDVNLSTKPGWAVYTASTGVATTAPKIQPGGVIYSAPAASGGLVFTDTGLGSVTLADQSDVSLDTIASSNTARVRLLVRLDNNQWYASNTEFTPVTAGSWSVAFANNLPYRRRIQFSTAAANWSLFNGTPGVPMGLGAALTSNLPSSTITGIGWYVANISPAYGVTARFDNIDLPAVNVLNCIGEVTTIPSINGTAALTLDGAPRIVYGLAAGAAQDVEMDNAGRGVTKTGTWTASTSATDFFGADYIHDGNASKGSKSVKFSPNLGATASYRVDAWWSAGANRAPSVPITVNHAGGATTTNVNQQLTGGQWITLGTYTFNKGSAGNVTVSNSGTSGYVVADAVRFVKQ